MFCLVFFIFASFIFGFTIVAIIKSTQIQLFQRSFISWICGVQLTGFILFVTSYFHEITSLHIFSVSFLEVLASILLFLRNAKRTKFSEIFVLEKSRYFYFLLLTILVIFSWYLKCIYFEFPNKINDVGIKIFQKEFSFISSLKGINNRRSDFFGFKDPNCIFNKFNEPTFSLIYISCCTFLGGSYNIMSYFICLLNLISTASFLFLYSLQFLAPLSRVLLVFCFMFNGGIEFFTNLISGNGIKFKSFDLYHPVLHLMSFSKNASFSIPLSIIALAFIQNRYSSSSDLNLALLLMLITPSFSTSLSIFFISSCYYKSLGKFIKFTPYFIFRYFLGNRFKIISLWVEPQMEGIFCSKFIVWILMFGTPIIFLCYNIIFQKLKKLLKIFIPNFAIFLFFNLIRYGNGISDNCIALYSAFLPQLLIIFIISLNRLFSYKSRNKQLEGVSKFSALFFYLTYIIGSIIILKNTINKTHNSITEYDIDIGNVITKYVDNNSIILSKQRFLSPISFLSGKQMILDNFTDSWRRNCDPTIAANIFRNIKETQNCILQMKKYGIYYLLEESQEPLCNLTSFNLLYSNSNWNFYKIK